MLPHFLCVVTLAVKTGCIAFPATGKLVAELVTGTPPHLDPAPYALSRF